METLVGSYIRELRKAKGLSLRRLAEEAGIDFTYLSKVETNKIPPPSQEALIRLANVLDADSDELLSMARKVEPALYDFLVTEKDAPKLLRAWKDGQIEEANRILRDQGRKKDDGSS